jgi:transglutaminase-like putative cysteine protease
MSSPSYNGFMRTGLLRRAAFLGVFFSLLLVPLGLIVYKLHVLRYPLRALLPVSVWQMELYMQMDGHGDDLAVSTFLPRGDARQSVSDERNSSGKMVMSITGAGENRFASWKAEGVEGPQTITYSFSARASHVRYRIPPGMPIPGSWPAQFAPDLAASAGIQKDDPLVAAELARLFPEGRPDVLTAVTRIHRRLQDGFANRDFSGYTDALTALKLGEASCNGKSRLFAALARALGMPARLVGGIILKKGSKRVTHQWVEVFIGGHWVPFDAINDRFAEIPDDYLTLYYGDEVLFTHTANANFQYSFRMAPSLVPRGEALANLGSSPLNVLNVYDLFARVGIPLDLLKIILMIPLGALVTVVFRNVIGVQTFGTFLPALIAAAARETGLAWGLAGFTLIILAGALLRKSMDWMQLLHSPKMGVMLTAVVLAMMGITLAGVRFGLFEIAHITLFPIAILAITAERFALIETEQGFAKAARILAVTLVVVAACYAVMGSLFLQSAFLAFPELLLVVIALQLWLGKWIGIRVLEFLRFHRLILEGRR